MNACSSIKQKEVGAGGGAWRKEKERMKGGRKAGRQTTTAKSPAHRLRESRMWLVSGRQ